MVEVGGKPILWHILKYIVTIMLMNSLFAWIQGYLIKEYFANYFLQQVTLPSIWIVTIGWKFITGKVSLELLVDTGESSLTGGRLGRVRDYLGSDSFCLHMGMELLT